MTKYVALLLALSACSDRGIQIGGDLGADLGHADLSQPAPDGGTCAFPDYQPCSAGSFCAVTCQQTPHPVEPVGTCTTIPSRCPALYDPVCGCDGKTYGNECEASSASVSVASKGACAFCGGLAGVRCQPDQFCSYTLGAQCGFSDASGTCMPRPQACLDDTPVCGCDGQTYSNECVANMNGVSIQKTGACMSP